MFLIFGKTPLKRDYGRRFHIDQTERRFPVAGQSADWSFFAITKEVNDGRRQKEHRPGGQKAR